MNISERQYSSLQSIVANLIDLDQSKGIDLSFDKIRVYIQKGCYLSGIELDDETYRRLENDIEYQYHIRHTEEGVIRNDYEDFDEWYANDKIENPYFWQR